MANSGQADTNTSQFFITVSLNLGKYLSFTNYDIVTTRLGNSEFHSFRTCSTWH